MHRYVWKVLCVCCFLVLCTTTMLQCKGGNCFVLCEVGLAICKPGGLSTCTKNQETSCLEWRFQACPLGQGCVETPAPAKCSAEANCTDKYASRKCVGNEVFYFDNCDRQREKFLICQPGTQCSNGSCLGEGCNECKAGEQRCTSSGWLSVCSRDPVANCMKWSTPIACPTGKVCINGGCEKGECPKPCVVGEYRCQDKSLQSCAKATTGCDDWGPIYPCPEGEACKDGKCAKEICPDTCQITADCAVTACGKRTACESNQCAEPVGPCEDKCKEKETRCDGAKLQICRKEANNCFDWGPATDCLAGQICQDKVCVQEPCPATCTEDNDCKKAACGAKTSCVKGVCDVPEQICPSQCTKDSECDIPNCLAKKACLAGKCSLPGASEGTADAGEATPEVSGDMPPEAMATWKYGNNVNFSTRNNTNTKADNTWGTELTDFINHENSNDPNNQPDPIDRAHAVLRGIHSELRTANSSAGSKKAGLYLGQGRTIVLPEPAMTKDKVGAFVPVFVRTGSTSRYNNFVTGSTSWNDRPLFLFDEWVVHTGGALVALNQHDQSLSVGSKSGDVMLDTIEFTIYALATAMAIKQHDASYFATQTQFLEFTAWFTAEAFKVLRRRAVNAAFTNTRADEYITKLKTHADAKNMRDFCIATFGQKWFDDVIKP